MTEKYENEAHQKPVGKMSPDEINIFLEKGYTLRLSCLKPNGDPFIVPCWHHWEKNNEKSTEEKIEGDFYVIPRAKSKWAEYLDNDSRCSWVIDDEHTMEKVLC